MDSSNNKDKQAEAFAAYMQSTIRLDTLEKMTSALDDELNDSQKMMTDIKAMFNSIGNRTEPVENDLRHEDLSKFLETGVPKLLMQNMDDSARDVNLDNVIATMKGYAEDLKMNFVLFQTKERESRKDMSSLDLEQYASSLDQLGKRLANIKLCKKEEACVKNAELEAKLSQLCQDVTLFTQIVEAKSTLSERNKAWTESQRDTNTFYYDEIINKLLAGINEVTYLLQNKN